MIRKNKKYTYEEFKKMFEEAEAETIINPFGKNQNKAEEELDGRAQFMTRMIGIQIVQTLKENLFGKESDE